MAQPDQPAKQRRLAATAALAERRLRKAELARFAPFLRLFYRWTAPEDVCALTAENLFGAAHAIWRLGRKRRPGEPAIRVYNPTAGGDAWASPHTVVEIVNDDMPFLVDSVTAGLERRGCRVQLVIHPILSVVRGRGGAARLAAAAGEDAPGAVRESWIHAEIDLCTDPARLAEIGADLERILADVRHTVADWRPILERGRGCRGDAAGPRPPASIRPRATRPRRSWSGWPRTISRSSATAASTTAPGAARRASAPCRGRGSGSCATPISTSWCHSARAFPRRSGTFSGRRRR